MATNFSQVLDSIAQNAEGVVPAKPSTNIAQAIQRAVPPAIDIFRAITESTAGARTFGDVYNQIQATKIKQQQALVDAFQTKARIEDQRKQRELQEKANMLREAAMRDDRARLAWNAYENVRSNSTPESFMRFRQKFWSDPLLENAPHLPLSMIQQRLGDLEVEAGVVPKSSAPSTRRRISGTEVIQEEFDPNTQTYREVGRGPRFKPGGMGSPTAAQQANNAEIDAARQHLRHLVEQGLNYEDIQRNTVKADPRTGRINTQYDPLLAGIVKRATQRKVGADPDFESWYRRVYGLEPRQNVVPVPRPRPEVPALPAPSRPGRPTGTARMKATVRGFQGGPADFPELPTTTVNGKPYPDTSRLVVGQSYRIGPEVWMWNGQTFER